MSAKGGLQTSPCKREVHPDMQNPVGLHLGVQVEGRQLSRGFIEVAAATDDRRDGLITQWYSAAPEALCWNRGVVVAPRVIDDPQFPAKHLYSVSSARAQERPRVGKAYAKFAIRREKCASFHFV